MGQAQGLASNFVVLDDKFQADSRYAISGEFGTVSLVAERPIPRLKGP